MKMGSKRVVPGERCSPGGRNASCRDEGTATRRRGPSGVCRGVAAGEPVPARPQILNSTTPTSGVRRHGTGFRARLSARSRERTPQAVGTEATVKGIPIFF